MLIGVGSIAGVCAQSIVYPLDVIRRRIQLKSVSQISTPGGAWVVGGAGGVTQVVGGNVNVIADTTWLAFKQVVRTEGVGSLFGGIGATFSKSVLSVGTTAMVLGSLVSYFKKQNKVAV